MSFKCLFCSRSFSRRTAYSQHVTICIKKVDVEEDDDVEMNTEGDQNSDDNIEVIMLFHVISYIFKLKKKFSIINY